MRMNDRQNIDQNAASIADDRDQLARIASSTEMYSEVWLTMSHELERLAQERQKMNLLWYKLQQQITTDCSSKS